MIIFRLISILPFSVLYVISDFLAFIAFRIIGYRKKIVIKNLKNSFPEKSTAEIKSIAKNFYKNLADTLVETIKCMSISPEDLSKRVILKNLPLLESYLQKGHSVITMASHQGNWEYLLLVNSLKIKNGVVIAAFQKVKHERFDQVMKKLRSRFGANLVEKKNILKEMVRKSATPRVFALVADQTPVELTNRYWTTFLNQQTPFFSGAEKIAIKYNMVVIFVQMKRIRRGYYEVEFSEISIPPYQEQEFFITKSYVEKVEADIKKDPANWLWSHKRWKHKDL
ncbi:lysophospholipid acyltransferase family protein [soil metagenome]